MVYLFDILHWPLFLSYSAISQGEILHCIKYRMQFNAGLDVYDVKAEVDDWVEVD